MLLINYEILEEERNRISKKNHISEFADDLNTIMGQIQLIFNETVEGFVDKEIPYDGEFLLVWFILLNDVLIYLNVDCFVTIHLPDTNNIWFEFELKNGEVVVSKIRAEKQKHIQKFVENSPRKRNELIWSERISKNELYKTIIDSTGIFIRDIMSINEILSELSEFKELKNKYAKSKRLY